jgi:hypothetical protein
MARVIRSAWRLTLIGVALLVTAAHAQPVTDPAFDQLEKSLPAGWTMLATGSELVFRHDRPCYVATAHHANPPTPKPTSTTPPGAPSGPPTQAKPTASPGGPLVNLELRFRVEPRWSELQIAAVKKTNDKVANDLRALSAKYHIDQIHRAKGKPAPATADERARLAGYDSEHARIAKRLVPVPHCAIGDVSVFDGEDTYAQLALELDPPEVIPEAHRVLALIQQRCR